jgi:NAD(P)-dependent dehydrogenase (short-subunit alcohol dehydrogenase family)
MSDNRRGKPVCVVIGATSKWQSDGRMTNLLHGHDVDANIVPVGVRWGVGGAIAQKFAEEGFFTVVTTRTESNAAGLAAAIREQGGEGMIVELDLSSQDSISNAFQTIRAKAGEPDVLVYNAGYLDGRELPADRNSWSTSRSGSSTPPSTSQSAARSSSPRRCCRRCARRARDRSSSRTIRARCAARSA